jgi:polyisoprenoid-binding protein YceI
LERFVPERLFQEKLTITFQIWKIDPSHSQVTFSVRHMMIANVHGRFENLAGEVHFDEQDPTQSLVNIQIQAGSINTRDPKRDDHLKSDDFLKVEEYPYITFLSKRVEKIEDTHGRITGDLTIRGITNEVVLDVEYHGQAKSPWGAISAGFSASTRIKRKDWGLTWNVALETGGVLVGDDVNINIEMEIIKQEVQEPEGSIASS